MKTITIYRAYDKASGLVLFGRNRSKKERTRKARHRRQKNKFYTILLRRLETGDRAREAMDDIYDALTMTAPISGKYNLIVDAVNDYRAGR